MRNLAAPPCRLSRFGEVGGLPCMAAFEFGGRTHHHSVGRFRTVLSRGLCLRLLRSIWVEVERVKLVAQIRLLRLGFALVRTLLEVELSMQWV